MYIYDQILSRILVLSPHRDDEVLGVGGTLLQCQSSIHIHYFNTTHPDYAQDLYDKEASAVAERLRATTSYSKNPHVNQLDTEPISVYISEIESIITTFKPQTLFIPCPDYNQDHRVVYDAAMTAARIHDKNWLVKNMLLYEQPETHAPAYSSFTPNLYIPIDIEDKINLYLQYQTQVRGHRSPDHLRYIAGMRGMQCRRPFAEAFQVVRMMA